jgi:hypothetical protein
LFHITASQFNKLAWLLTILALFGLSRLETPI